MIKLVHSRSHEAPKLKGSRLRLVHGSAGPRKGAKPTAQTAPSGDEPLVSEFYVHAILQAARAEKLGLDEDAAKSWGLNRAIFYEAAKKGYFHRGGKPSSGGSRSKRRSNFGQLFSLGKEKAFAVQTEDGSWRFVIGGQAQSPQAFDRQIKTRFPKWTLVWSEATQLMERAGPSVLKSPSRFHAEIYKAWRETLTRRWPRGQKAIAGATRAA